MNVLEEDLKNDNFFRKKTGVENLKLINTEVLKMNVFVEEKMSKIEKKTTRNDKIKKIRLF